MSFNAISQNKVLTKISEFAVHVSHVLDHKYLRLAKNTQRKQLF